MLGNRLNKYISGCRILCLRWLRTNVYAKCINGYTWADPEGRQGVRTPPDKSQKYRFFLAIWVKATKQAFNVESSSARQRIAI